MNRSTDDINMLVKILDDDLRSGRHDSAECFDDGGYDCKKPVRYRMTIVVNVLGEQSLDTRYFCESHKPT